MKSLMIFCLTAFFPLPVGLFAQNDNFRLVCPLNEATLVLPEKNTIRYVEPDLTTMLVSSSDTIVKAVYSGRITNTEFNDDAGHGLVLYARINKTDYYFWYTGMCKLAVQRNETVLAGQPLGFLRPGAKMELLMYRFETPLDVTKYLDCDCTMNGGMKAVE